MQSIAQHTQAVALQEHAVLHTTARGLGKILDPLCQLSQRALSLQGQPIEASA